MLTAEHSNGTTTDAETVLDAAETIRAYVLDVAQATKAEVREHLKAKGFSTDAYQKGWARIANQAKQLTEVAREDGSKGYELRRVLRSLTFREWLESVEEAAAPSKPREHFGDWYLVTGTLTLRMAALSSRAVPGNASARMFLRGTEGQILLPSGYFQAMWELAARGQPGVPEIGNARYQVRWDLQELPESLIVHLLNPVPPSRPGASGQGLTDVEALPPGARIPFSVTVPRSHISGSTFMLAMAAAGRWVGFSPSAAKLGWGAFAPHIDNPEVLLLQAPEAA